MRVNETRTTQTASRLFHEARAKNGDAQTLRDGVIFLSRTGENDKERLYCREMLKIAQDTPLRPDSSKMALQATLLCLSTAIPPACGVPALLAWTASYTIPVCNTDHDRVALGNAVLTTIHEVGNDADSSVAVRALGLAAAHPDQAEQIHYAAFATIKGVDYEGWMQGLHGNAQKAVSDFHDRLNS